MSASSSGNFYPGSTFAASHPGPSRQGSGSTSRSTISVESALLVVDTIRRSLSLEALARSLSRDVGDLEGTVQELNARFKSTDPMGYKKRDPWSDAMDRARDRYKHSGEVHGRAHRLFDEAYARTRKHATPEDHVERAKLAIEWAKASVVAAEARLEFMITYRNAYQYSGIDGHIKAARGLIDSAKDSIHEARLNYENIWISHGRSADPLVFK
jgi:hypothetical protein